jgi:hypothetical protein
MGVRGLDIATAAKRQVADAAARTEAKAVVERWNEQLAASRDMLWSPTIRAALIAGTPWLDVFCPGCGTSRAINLRKGRPPSPRLGRDPCPGAAMLLVPRVGADAGDPRLARAPACSKDRGVESVIWMSTLARFGCFAAPR